MCDGCHSHWTWKYLEEWNSNPYRQPVKRNATEQAKQFPQLSRGKAKSEAARKLFGHGNR